MRLLPLFMAGFMFYSVQAMATSCQADVVKFCSQIEKGPGQPAHCLKQHEVELSSLCKEERERVKVHLQNATKACEKDLQQFCAREKPGEGRVMACLKSNWAKVSKNCKREFHHKP